MPASFPHLCQPAGPPGSKSNTEVHSVCAVVVTYRPEPAFVDNLAAIAAQVDQIVVIDNGSPPETQRQLLGLEQNLGYKIICNRQNLGIAAALNLGVKYAMGAGFAWIATFDQDSRISDRYFSAMLATYGRYCRTEKVGLVVPTYCELRTGVKVRLRRTRSGEILAAMTSGSLVSARLFSDIGFFNEAFFIDGVDKEFCVRARRKGTLLLQSPAVLFHSPGRTTYHSLFGLRFGVTNHSPERRYYITRNSLWLLSRYSQDWSWAWREAWGMCQDAVKIVLVEKDKMKKFHAMALGVAHALVGKMGKQLEL